MSVRIDGLHAEARRAWELEGKLFTVHLDLLYQCDLDCVHCYLDDKSVRLRPTAFWLDVVDQLAELEVFEVLLSGGEVFLRPDVFEIIARARSRGIFVDVKTHGGTLDAAAVERLAELGVTSVSISYYSTRPEVHDAITRRPGSHARTLRAIELLAARDDILSFVVCPVMEENRESYPEVVAQMAELGMMVDVSGHIRVANSGSAATRDGSLALDSLVELRRHELRRAGPDSPCEGEWTDGKHCGAGHVALYVSPDGEVTPCTAWPRPLGNLAKGERLADIWAHSAYLREIRAYRSRDRGVCAECAIREHCAYCPGESFLERGDANLPPASVCLSTKAQAIAHALEHGLPMPPDPPGLAERRVSPFRILR